MPATTTSNSSAPSYDWVLRILQLFGLLGVIGAIPAVMNAATAIGGGSEEHPWWTKFTDVLIALSCLLAAWYAFSEHLLVWSLNY